MRPVEPRLHEGGSRIVFGPDQPPYQPLPASVDGEGTVVTEWELTAEELHQLFIGGRLRLWILYTDLKKPFKPIKIEVVEAPCPMDPQ